MDASDAMVLVGALFVVAGVALIALPAGIIAGGLALIGLAYLSEGTT